MVDRRVGTDYAEVCRAPTVRKIHADIFRFHGHDPAGYGNACPSGVTDRKYRFSLSDRFRIPEVRRVHRVFDRRVFQKFATLYFEDCNIVLHCTADVGSFQTVAVLVAFARYETVVRAVGVQINTVGDPFLVTVCVVNHVIVGNDVRRTRVLVQIHDYATTCGHIIFRFIQWSACALGKPATNTHYRGNVFCNRLSVVVELCLNPELFAKIQIRALIAVFVFCRFVQIGHIQILAVRAVCAVK